MSATLDKVTELFWDRAKTITYYPHSFHNRAQFCLFSLPHFYFYYRPICFSKGSTNLTSYPTYMGLQRAETHWREYEEGKMIRRWQMIAAQGQELNTVGALGTRPGMKSKTKLSLPSLSGVIERHSYEICVPLLTPSLRSWPRFTHGPRRSSRSPNPSEASVLHTLW